MWLERRGVWAHFAHPATNMVLTRKGQMVKDLTWELKDCPGEAASYVVTLYLLFSKYILDSPVSHYIWNGKHPLASLSNPLLFCIYTILSLFEFKWVQAQDQIKDQKCVLPAPFAQLLHFALPIFKFDCSNLTVTFFNVVQQCHLTVTPRSIKVLALDVQVLG